MKPTIYVVYIWREHDHWFDFDGYYLSFEAALRKARDITDELNNAHDPEEGIKFWSRIIELECEEDD